MTTIHTTLSPNFQALQLNRSQEALARSIGRLSSGSKLNDPAADSAQVGDAQKLDSQTQRIQAALTNVQNGASYVQTADGFMGSMGKILSRMSELSTLASDPMKNTSDSANYQQEFQSLQQQLRDMIGGTTAQIGGTSNINNPLGSYNSNALFQANPTGTTITVGSQAGNNLTIGQSNLQTGNMLSIIQQDSSGNFTMNLSSPSTLATVDGATQEVAYARAQMGAVQTRLDIASSSLQVESQNVQSAFSQINDVDVASESTQYAKYNIMVQASASMLTQANQLPQSV